MPGRKTDRDCNRYGSNTLWQHQTINITPNISVLTIHF